MHTVEFKTEITDGIIKVPKEYKEFQNSFVSISITTEDDARVNHLNDNIITLDFSACEVTCFEGINPVDYQRKIRDVK